MPAGGHEGGEEESLASWSPPLGPLWLWVNLLHDTFTFLPVIPCVW